MNKDIVKAVDESNGDGNPRVETGTAGVILFSAVYLLFFYNTGLLVFGLLFFLLLLISVFYKRRFQISIPVEILLTAIPAVASVFLSDYRGISFTSNIMVMARIPYYILAFLLCFNLMIRVYRKKTLQDIYIAYLSAFLILLISTGYIGTRDMYVNIPLFTVFALCSILYFHSAISVSYKTAPNLQSPWQSRLIPFLIIVPLLTGASIWLGLYTKKREPDILKQFARHSPRGGDYSLFGSTTTLSTIEDIYQSPVKVMKIFSDRDMGRVRGGIYDNYNGGQWRITAKPSNIFPLNEKELDEDLVSGFVLPGNNLFPLRAIPEIKIIRKADINRARFYILSGGNRILYMPENGAFASVKNDQLTLDPLGNIKSPKTPIEFIEILCPPAGFGKAVVNRETFTDEDLKVPEKMKSFLRETALKAVGDKETPTLKIMAIDAYLKDNFEYHAGIQRVEKTMDPVQEFLTYKRAAHCEYFASAMVLMLRSLGIPARYVVGFVVHEYNRTGEYYIVREKDAHAWVLAYIPRMGWVEFDPTPPQAQPGFNSRPSHDWLDFQLTRLHILFTYLKSGEFRKFFSMLSAEMGGWIKINYPVVIVVFILFFALKFIRAGNRDFSVFKLFGNKIKTGMSYEGADVEKMHRMLADFDRRIGRFQLNRPKNLTLKEFAGKLEEEQLGEEAKANCREFLFEYYQLRYGKERIEPGDLEVLGEKLKTIR